MRPLLKVSISSLIISKPWFVGSLWITTLYHEVIGCAALKATISLQILWFSSRYLAVKAGVVVTILFPFEDSVTEATTGDCTPPLEVKA